MFLGGRGTENPQRIFAAELGHVKQSTVSTLPKIAAREVSHGSQLSEIGKGVYDTG